MRILLASSSVTLPLKGIVTSVWFVDTLLDERLTPLIFDPATTGLTARSWRCSSDSIETGADRGEGAGTAAGTDITFLRVGVFLIGDYNSKPKVYRQSGPRNDC